MGPEKADDSASTIRSSDRADSQGRFVLFQEASLPLSQAILILLGILNTLLGLLLFPVCLGMLPFSPDGQLGLLLTIMAIQMMILGDTPLGQYTPLTVHDNHWHCICRLGSGFMRCPRSA